MKQFQQFRMDICDRLGHPRYVPTRPGEAGNKPMLHRIPTRHHDDGDRRRGIFGRLGYRPGRRHDDIHLHAD